MFQMKMQGKKKQITHIINIQFSLNIFQKIAKIKNLFFNKRTSNKFHQNKRK